MTFRELLKITRVCFFLYFTIKTKNHWRIPLTNSTYSRSINLLNLLNLLYIYTYIYSRLRRLSRLIVRVREEVESVRGKGVREEVEQREQREQREEVEQREQREEVEQREQREQREEVEQYEQREQPKQLTGHP